MVVDALIEKLSMLQQDLPNKDIRSTLLANFEEINQQQDSPLFSSQIKTNEKKQIDDLANVHLQIPQPGSTRQITFNAKFFSDLIGNYHVM